MSLVDRTKTALDESRMLMLGTQILLGFQFQAPFQDAFSVISATEKFVVLVTLAIITIVAGLLIAPSARHRIVDDGEASPALLRFIAIISTMTMPSLALAIGLDLGVAGMRISGPTLGALSAIIGVAAPLALWFGPLWLRQSKEEAMPTSDEKTPLDAKIDYVLTEARVVLPGAQALLGFQLAIVLTNGFAALPFETKLVHGVGLGLMAIAMALLIAPAAYHRLIYRGRSDPQFYRLAGRLILAATIFLALGVAADAYVVAIKISGSELVASSLGIAVALMLLGLWQIWPWWARRRSRTVSA
jgi:hypothetical protein